MKVNVKDFKNYIKEEPSIFIKRQLQNLEYEDLSKDKEKELILKIIKTIFEKKIKKSGKSYKKNWEKGWEENYKNYKKSKKNYDLIPKYFFKSKIARIGNKLIFTKNKLFDFKILRVITNYVYEKYLISEKNIVEFGCGTGHNLVALSKINKKANLLGLDWSKSSQKIFKIINKKNSQISGYPFDYFNPILDKNIKLIDDEWACFTVASLEQIGNNFKKFVNFLKLQKPKIIINIEPINELMSQKSILDYLSVQYSLNRNYLNNYYNYLKKLEEKKIIKILEVKKSHFGSFYINGYSIIVWKFR
ncbi:class I SAM-dependent methyltransferase [Candidatus Pelagibacter sp.]|nr:class I SAM-dependent methyltransferase [Candidatus Pelagibacter sp.]MDC1070627.1 class I SAM-dependent methyltransferase [Candidatus Pelagibacter sp.]